MNETDTVTLRIVKSSDDELSHYYTLQINEWGCLQIDSYSFEPGNALLESFTCSPEDGMKLADSVRFICQEELDKERF